MAFIGLEVVEGKPVEFKVRPAPPRAHALARSPSLTLRARRPLSTQIPGGCVAELKIASLVEGGACTLSLSTEDFHGKPVTVQLAVLRPNSGSETMVSGAAAAGGAAAVARAAGRAATRASRCGAHRALPRTRTLRLTAPLTAPPRHTPRPATHRAPRPAPRVPRSRCARRRCSGTAARPPSR